MLLVLEVLPGMQVAVQQLLVGLLGLMLLVHVLLVLPLMLLVGQPD